MIRSAREVTVVADSSKIGSSHHREYLEGKGIEVVVVPGRAAG